MMKFSTRARYGLRAMVELVLIYDGVNPVMAQTIAKRQRIPKRYLENLLVTLKSADVVRSVRGSQGGYILARAPTKITALEVVEALEGPIRITDCVEHKDECALSVVCATTDLWAELTKAMRKVLSSWTLQDLADRAREKKEVTSFMYHI